VLEVGIKSETNLERIGEITTKKRDEFLNLYNTAAAALWPLVGPALQMQRRP
jgi:hypothetical protein